MASRSGHSEESHLAGAYDLIILGVPDIAVWPVVFQISLAQFPCSVKRDGTVSQTWEYRIGMDR